MSRARRGIGILCVAIPWLCVAMAAQANEGEQGGPSRADQICRKLGRGVANIATAPVELIRVPTLLGRSDGYLSAMSVGIVQGAWQAVRRVVAGVVEVATFYADSPKGSGPLVTPEFVWSHGHWNE